MVEEAIDPLTPAESLPPKRRKNLTVDSELGILPNSTAFKISWDRGVLRGPRVGGEHEQACKRRSTSRYVQSEAAALFSAIAFSGILSAQETWQGLRFGMSRAEVEKTYEGKLQPEEQYKDGGFSLSDHNQKLFVMPAVATLFFDGTGKLNGVILRADNPFANRGAVGTVGITM
jgi:hypothetical protein